MEKSEVQGSELVEMRRAIELLRAQVEGKQARELEASEARAERLQQELSAMTQAAITREKEYSRREAVWGDKILASSAEAQTAKMEAEHLRDKLAEMEATVRHLTAQTMNYDAMVRSQAAKIGATEGAAQRLGEMEAERDVLRARVAELLGARSRRLLLKLGLVGRCGWEKA